MRPNVLIAVLFTFAACALSSGQTGSTGSTATGGANTSGTATAGTATGGSAPSGGTTTSGLTTSAPAETATITFAEPAMREVWIQAGQCTGPTPDSIKPSGGVVEVPLTGKSATDTVYIWDHKAGNMAETTVGALRKAFNLVLPAGAFSKVAEVKIRLEHLGQPVSSAVVTVEDTKKPQVQVLDPTTKGELTFYDLAPGALKVTAQFRALDGSQKSMTQIVNALLGRGDPAAIGVLSIPDDVATIAATTSTTPAGTTPPSTTAGAGVQTVPATTGTTGNAGSAGPAGTTGTGATGPNSQNPGNPVGSAFAYLLGIAVVAACVYFLWRYAKANPDAVQSKLHQLGVDVPKAGDDPRPFDQRQFDPAAAPAPRQSQPVQKIILPDSTPEPLSPYSASNVVTTSGEPKLWSESGDAMKLPPGETVVGRDAGLGLSLVGESTVSRKHAQLTRNGNEVTVADLGSTNGTYVNGMALTGPQTLRPGDTVQFGAVRFRYEG